MCGYTGLQVGFGYVVHIRIWEKPKIVKREGTLSPALSDIMGRIIEYCVPLGSLFAPHLNMCIRVATMLSFPCTLETLV